MSYFKLKMHQIRFRLGLRPRPCWGVNSAPPDPLAGFKESTSEEKKGRKGRENRYRPPTIFGLKVALGWDTVNETRSEDDVPGHSALALSFPFHSSSHRTTNNRHFCRHSCYSASVASNHYFTAKHVVCTCRICCNKYSVRLSVLEFITFTLLQNC